jgi:SMODS-associated and fused to various effectors sensor domain
MPTTKKPTKTKKLTAKPAKGRAKIPDHVILELWARAAGLCEYRGCTKPVYMEGLTKARLNAANIAHIVGASKQGPRGDHRSEELETDISNLMLTCLDHHKLCDFQGSSEGVTRHTEKELRNMKQEREHFIQHALKMIPKHETYTITVSGRISGNQPSSITKKHIREALWQQQLLPINDESLKIAPMNGSEHDALDENGWVELRKLTDRKLDSFLEEHKPSHVSVFGLARIPLLVSVGHKIGDKVEVQTFQPTDNSYVWPDSSATDGFDVIGPEAPLHADHVVLKLEVSGSIPDHGRPSEIPSDAPIISIRFAQPRPRSVRSTGQVIAFAEKVRQVYEQYNLNGQSGKHVHVLPAVPCAIALEFGRSIRQHYAKTSLYEWQNDKWVRAFDVTN